jgi:hypothetical protein
MKKRFVRVILLRVDGSLWHHVKEDEEEGAKATSATARWFREAIVLRAGGEGTIKTERGATLKL